MQLKTIHLKTMAEEYLNHYARLAPDLNNVKPLGLTSIDLGARSRMHPADLASDPGPSELERERCVGLAR